MGFEKVEGGRARASDQVRCFFLRCYRKPWNASTNSPPLVSSTGTQGTIYKVSTTGTTTLNGISQWNAGDFAFFDGTTWDKVDGLASEVISVAGRTGNVVLGESDITGLAASLAALATQGVPTGGTTGQVLTKNSNTNYDDAWATIASGLSGSGTMGQLAKWSSSSALGNAEEGTDYLAPGGSGAALTGIAATVASGTSGRVPYETSGGLLTDSANLTFDGMALGVGANLSITGTTISNSSGGMTITSSGDLSMMSSGGGSFQSFPFFYMRSGGVIWNGTQLGFNSPSDFGTGSVGLQCLSSGVLRITNGSTGPGSFSCTALTPAALSGNTNNLSLAPARFNRISASTTVNLTGLVAGQDGEERRFWNVGSNTITLTNQDTNSTSANRWLTTTGSSLALAANQCAFAVYDATTAAWRVSLLP